MRKAKNNPGLQVGNKIRLNYKWIDEHGNSKTGPLGDIGIVTKVNSRYFYTKEELKVGGVMKTRNTWDKADFQKDDDIWLVTINLVKRESVNE